jgi:hypothetical protein
MFKKDVATYSAVDRPFELSLARTLDTIASGQLLAPLPKPAVKLHMQSVRFEANRTKAALTKALSQVGSEPT